MTNYEQLKSMSAEQLSMWLDENVKSRDAPPWELWFDLEYCKKCPEEWTKLPDLPHEVSCAWCELHGKCKHFQQYNDMLTSIQMISLWLDAEYVPLPDEELEITLANGDVREQELLEFYNENT